jgi:hypothetical protein
LPAGSGSVDVLARAAQDFRTARCGSCVAHVAVAAGLAQVHRRSLCITDAPRHCWVSSSSALTLGWSAERDLGEHGGAVGHVIQREVLAV